MVLVLNFSSLVYLEQVCEVVPLLVSFVLNSSGPTIVRRNQVMLNWSEDARLG